MRRKKSFNKYLVTGLLFMMISGMPGDASAEQILEEHEQILYCSSEDGVYIRDWAYADGEVIGGLKYGDPVYVIGELLENGESIGWNKIGFAGKTGYVSSAYLTEEGPIPEEELLNESSVIELINAKGDTTIAYEALEGAYMDSQGRHFYYDGGETWFCETGSEWNFTLEYAEKYDWSLGHGNVVVSGSPMQMKGLPGSDTGKINLINDEGEVIKAYLLTDGAYMDLQGREFTYDGYETWYCVDGSRWSLTPEQ